MASLLYRLGRTAFRRRWLFTLLWAVVLAAVGTGALLAPSAPDTSFSMPGTESQKAFDLIHERFPASGSADGAVARVVFVAPSGQQVTDPANKAAIDEVMTDAAASPQVQHAGNPFTDGTVNHPAAGSGTPSTAYATITFTGQPKSLTAATKATVETAVQQGRDAGLTVEVGGDALAAQTKPGGSTELLGVAVAAVVLLITFASLVAAGLPLLTALIGVGTGAAGIIAVSSAFGLASNTTTLATMLGLAVGIDYAVLIVSRFREERAKGRTPHEAVGRAVGTAGSSVVFAGLTVVIGLAGLSVVGIPMLTKMGLAAAATVVVAVLVAITLVPALLGFAQNRVMPRKARRAEKTEKQPHAAQATNMGTRWSRFVLRHPVAVLLTGVVGLGALAVPALSLHLGTQGDESKSTATSERRAYDDLAHGFGAGTNGPLTVVVDTKGAHDPHAAVQQVTNRLESTKGVVAVSPARFDKGSDAATLTVIPSTAPDSQATVDLIHTIRDERPGLHAQTGATFYVTGQTANDVDSAAKTQGALVPYLGVVVGLAFLLLMIVFRSVLVPLKAALGFVLSVAAAIGAVVAVFQWGWLAGLLGVHTAGPIMSLMPIFMVGIVFGLAMDYEVFLVSRIREAYVHGEDARQAVVSGFRHSTRVVTAAALIMVSVFASFIGAGDSMIKMMGFGLAAAVLFDAFVVRMAIIPAAFALLGRAAWWMPRWLGRILPKVDIEGEALEREAAEQPGREPVSVG